MSAALLFVACLLLVGVVAHSRGEVKKLRTENADLLRRMRTQYKRK